VRSGVGRRAAGLGLIVACIVTIGYAQPAGRSAPYARDGRVAYLAAALDAVRGLGDAGRAELERALYQGARDQCRAALGTPVIACTIDVATAACAARGNPAGCAAAADVILTNQRAETEWVDEPTRMQLIGAGTDYHGALLGELDVRYGALAAELALAEPAPLTGADLAARIDRFCAGRDRGPDWQRCAAALVWYVGARVGTP
jgi:hypothetical protein